MATSPTLPSLNQAPNPNLVGFIAAYYLPQEDLVEEPLVVNGAVVGELVLAAGAGWRALPYTQGTLKLDEQPKADRGGPRYQVRVTAQRPQPDPGVLAVLAALDRRKLLLLLVEPGGGRRLIGTREEYVLLVTSTEGQNPATKAGVELRLEGETSHRAPYYPGGLPVLGGGAVPTGTSAPAGYVNVVDGTGKLLLSVPAGKTLVIKSWFKVFLSFK